MLILQKLVNYNPKLYILINKWKIHLSADRILHFIASIKEMNSRIVIRPKPLANL